MLAGDEFVRAICDTQATAVDEAALMAQRYPGQYVYLLEAKQGYIIPKPELVDFVMVDG
jgi:hypothetical protein